jgi:hypothetical protein
VWDGWPAAFRRNLLFGIKRQSHRRSSTLNGTLMVHTGGRHRTREELAALPTPPGTDTWKPVPHYELVESLIEGLTTHGITITREEYATSGRDDARLFGVVDLLIPDVAVPDFGMSLGIRGSNDRSLAIQATAGARVFVCDNLAFSGDSGTVVLKKKHTSGLDLRKVVPPAIDLYLEKAGAFVLDIETMKNLELSDAEAKAIIFDAFAFERPVMNRRMLPEVAHTYFRDDRQREWFPDRTVWSLNNAFTQVVKELPVNPQNAANIAIGRAFARIVRSRRAPVYDVAPDVDVQLPSDN